MIIVVAAVAIIAAPWGRSASAVLPGDVPIQPGAPLISPGEPWMEPWVETFCTMNFVFTETAPNPRTYIGTAKNCTRIGERARSPELGAFGTVVYQMVPHGARFALIEIDRDKLQYVSRVVRGFGAAPTGYTRSTETNAGDPLVTHGYPYGDPHAQGVTRVGGLGDDTPTQYWSSIQPNIQERGSPVVRSDGKAVGMSDEESSFWGTWLPEAPPIARYPTVEGILLELRSAGFNVTI